MITTSLTVNRQGDSLSRGEDHCAHCTGVEGLLDVTESLLHVPAELVREYRGQENTNDGTVQTAENAKHFEKKKTNGNSRLLQRQKISMVIMHMYMNHRT